MLKNTALLKRIKGTYFTNTKPIQVPIFNTNARQMQPSTQIIFSQAVSSRDLWQREQKEKPGPFSLRILCPTSAFETEKGLQTKEIQNQAHSFLGRQCCIVSQSIAMKAIVDINNEWRPSDTNSSNKSNNISLQAPLNCLCGNHSYC